MSAITIDNDLVHYEVLGRGRPVILVHGWLGSWRYWIPAMQQLSMKYRTYALDLWGFGESGKDPRRYDFESQVALLDQFMEKMCITKAALVGHSLGASVVAHYAAQHPDRVPRLMVISPPLFRLAPPIALTANPAPKLEIPKPLVIEAPKPASSEPVTQPITRVFDPAAAKPAETVESIQAEIEAEAETMPYKSEEMKARVRAALERRVREANAAAGIVNVPPANTPKSPREAAVPPADKPATEMVPAAPKLPEPLAEVPQMPKVDYVPDAREVQRANPLKDYIQSLDPIALLEKHVPAGSDQDKLKAEVSKADKLSIALSVESFAAVDTLRDLQTLPVPTVAVYGTKDTFLPQPDGEMQNSLREGRSTFHIMGLDDTRHFPMLENISQFTRLIMDFLEIPDVTKLAIKETWERRVR